MSSFKPRMAIVREDRCKPKKCRQECKKSCPVVSQGKQCIEVTPARKVFSFPKSYVLGVACVPRRFELIPVIIWQKCPFNAIQIVNLPEGLEKEITHRYGPASFRLHRLPMPKRGKVLGLVGKNGIGKSTALRILAGKLYPNLGKLDPAPGKLEVLTYFRGSELQKYFTSLWEDNLKAVVKPQLVDNIPKAENGKVGELLEKRNEKGTMKDELCVALELDHILHRSVAELSGGELQRFAIACAALTNADVYIFVEPSSYLDVKQRLKAAKVIRSLCEHDRYVIVVEHDLSMLDYLSDFVCCLYGEEGAYGVVTMPYSVREGINGFLQGFIPTENCLFRDQPLTLRVVDTQLEEIQAYAQYKYPTLAKSQGDFKLQVMKGIFTDSQIIVLLGENGTGKTTFVQMLAGKLKPDTVNGSMEVPVFRVSYKPQKIRATKSSTVRDLLRQKIGGAYTDPQFVSVVMKPLEIEQLMDQDVLNLSGGELQRVALALCLGKPADIYLIDEPSSYLDSEKRIVVSKVIKRFIFHSKKTAFVVEHDFTMATYLADKVIVYEGTPSGKCIANSPQSLSTGLNLFLSHLGITFRRDPTNYRPRINQLDSVKDKEQKSKGMFYCLDS